MKIEFKEWNPNAKSLARVDNANLIIDEYKAAGDRLTIRQLYYQHVARGMLENTENNYQNLIVLMTKSRNAGLTDWDAIDDNHRTHNGVYTQESEADIIGSIAYDIHYDFWERQENYVEVWIEKDALLGTIEKTCRQLKVPYMACKGYMSSSQSFLAGERYAEKAAEGKTLHLIHLGDHDPSGIDMTRDNGKRVDRYSYGADVNVHRIALNMDQIDEHNPPPNPAKETDSRFKDYRQIYGETSWELDALSPATLRALVKKEVDQLIDVYAWDETIDAQDEARDRLRRLSDNWPQVQGFLDELDDGEY